ncbi:AraC family transcriptional regulator [Vibrio fluvialis]|uniref:AraC family transcriptional regulator n=1 Tax=Vibrio fluvialis TaxID=676 RepID=UPI001C9CFB2C|nr:AraC family transcriptional regulator [Vibrio fluvialis]
MTHSLHSRIRGVCDYIDRHLDDELSLEQLSALAHCSKYHFHRMFKAQIGVGTAKYLTLARLKRASYRLAFEPGISVLNIALEAQFDSPEAFARAFARTFGQSPSGFRNQPEWQQWHSQFQFEIPAKGVNLVDVNIIHFAETRIAYIEHCGAPEQVLDTAAQFIAWRRASGESPVTTSATYGIPYSDPNETEPALFRFDIAGSVSQPVKDNDYGVKNGAIPAGRCAVLRHHGSHDAISQSVYALYRDWLPQSGEELRDYPCFFHYLNLIHEVDECDLQTDIYLPLK